MADDQTERDPFDEDPFDEPVMPLAEDNDTPSSPPDDPIADPATDLEVREQASLLDPTHPATDAAGNMDDQELYDEGVSGAAEAEEPNAGNAAVDYNPEQDRRKADGA